MQRTARRNEMKATQTVFVVFVVSMAMQGHAFAVGDAEKQLIAIDDQRPAEAKIGAAGSKLIAACDYSISRLDDGRIKPDRMTRLANFVNSRFTPAANDVVVV